MPQLRTTSWFYVHDQNDEFTVLAFPCVTADGSMMDMRWTWGGQRTETLLLRQTPIADSRAELPHPQQWLYGTVLWFNEVSNSFAESLFCCTP